MNAYMLITGKSVEPFNEHPGQCLIGNRRLSELQQEVINSLGHKLVPVTNAAEINDPGEHVIFTDSLLFDKNLLATFISESRRLGKRTICNLKTGWTTLRTVVNTQDVIINDGRVEYGLEYIPGSSSLDEVLPLVMDPDRFYESLPMPEHAFGLREYKVPLPDKFAVQIDHWVNLWAANMCSLLAEVCKLKAAPKLKQLALAARALSTNQWKILHKANHIGRNCDIHPTAYIEGSRIGNNVRIGANAVIRESIIGDNCNIENSVTLSFCVLGNDCYIVDGALARYSVLYPGVFFAFSPLSCSLLGRNSFMGAGVTLVDFRFDNAPVKVLKNGEPVDTGNTFIGSCLGHGVYLGSGTIVASGRAIPNGLRLYPENSRFIQKIDVGGQVPGYQYASKSQ